MWILFDGCLGMALHAGYLCSKFVPFDPDVVLQSKTFWPRTHPVIIVVVYCKGMGLKSRALSRPLAKGNLGNLNSLLRSFHASRSYLRNANVQVSNPWTHTFDMAKAAFWGASLYPPLPLYGLIITTLTSTTLVSTRLRRVDCKLLGPKV